MPCTRIPATALCPISTRFGHAGRAMAQMTAIRPTTIAMRIARYVKGSALLTTYLVPMKPVLHSRTKIAGAARGGECQVLGHLPSLLPDHMLCGKNRSRRATGAISHIEALLPEDLKRGTPWMFAPPSPSLLESRWK